MSIRELNNLRTVYIGVNRAKGQRRIGHYEDSFDIIIAMLHSNIGIYTKYSVCQCKVIKYLQLYIMFTPNCLPVNEHIEFLVRGSSKRV